MRKRIVDISFCGICSIMLCIPIIFANYKEGLTASDENRFLAKFPKLICDDGSLNTKFFTEMNYWIDDNIGFRTELVKLNSKVMYSVFGVLPESSAMYLGKNGELNYATSEMLIDYQHLNLKTEEELTSIADDYQVVSDYLRQQGIQYYYFQCWDKHSIYPEQFPKTVVQYGNISKTDQIVETLREKTTVNVISPKQALLDAKKDYPVYSVWGDPAHWTPRGAYVGYCELLNAINLQNDNLYNVLQEEEYDIKIIDQGYSVSGIREVDMLEKFDIMNPVAVKANEKLTLYSELADKGCCYYTNEQVDNDTRVLIIGDSYIGQGMLVDDMAESFRETILITATYTRNLVELIDAYKPDIVINENAERCERTGEINVVAKQIRALGN